MRRILYDGEVLYDPVIDVRISIQPVSSVVSGAGGGTFTIYPEHPLFNKFSPMDASKELVFLDGEREIFRGRITAQKPKINGSKEVSFEGVGGYLNDISIRPYGTYPDTPEEGEQPQWTTIAPNSRRIYAEWLIEQFNKYADGNKQFKIGVNDLTSDELVRSSTTRNSIRQEIQDKLIDYFDCFYIAYNYKGERYIDFRTSGGNIATQKIEFGVNLLDYALDTSYIDTKTCIIPRGFPEQGDEFGIESYVDGPVTEHVTKSGDRLIRSDLIGVYGIIEEERAYDAESVVSLISQAAVDLELEEASVSSLSISAVDLSILDPTLTPINIGDWVTTSALPLGFHAEMVCIEIKYDIQNPGNDQFFFGAELPTMSTGNKDLSSKIRQTEAVIIEKTAPLSQEIKANAKELKQKSKIYTKTPEVPYNDGDSWITKEETVTFAATGQEIILSDYASSLSQIHIFGPKQPEIEDPDTEPELDILDNSIETIGLDDVSISVDGDLYPINLNGESVLPGDELIVSNSTTTILREEEVIELPQTELPEILNKTVLEIVANDTPTHVGWIYSVQMTGDLLTTKVDRTIEEPFHIEDWEKVIQNVDGEDAILLNMIASNGTVLKNNEGSTTWEITIFRGSDEITNVAQMKALLGDDAKLTWKVKWSVDQEAFIELPEDDYRISDGGFKMEAKAEDIITQAIFKVELDY